MITRRQLLGRVAAVFAVPAKLLEPVPSSALLAHTQTQEADLFAWDGTNLHIRPITRELVEDAVYPRGLWVESELARRKGIP